MHPDVLAGLINDIGVPTTAGRTAAIRQHVLKMPAPVVAGALGDDEQAAVDDGRAALDQLPERLVDVPTPAGAIPREIGVPATATLLPIISAHECGERGGCRVLRHGLRQAPASRGGLA